MSVWEEGGLAESRRILFVCLGNIIRSPLAEHLFLHLAEQAGVGEKYFADSAGIGGWHVGEGPDPRMQKVAARHGLYYQHTARQFDRRDFDRFDLILAMDRDNFASLQALARNEADRAKVRKLRAFDPQANPNADVPDPYYDDLDDFEMVYQIIERSCRGLLQALETGQL